MSHDVSTLSPPAVPPNTFHAFRGVWYLTWRRFCTPGQFLLLLGMIGLLAMLSLVRIRYGRESDFLTWNVQFYLGFLLPAMAFLTGAAAIRDEMKSSTADYVLTRPIRRVHLVVFKYFSHLVCSQLFYLIVLGALLALGAVVHVPDLARAIPRLFLVQATALTCFSALGFLFGALSARYLVLGLTYAGTVEMAIGRIPTQLNQLSMTHQLNTLLQPLNLTGVSLFAQSASAASVMTLLLGYTALFIALCALVFSQRELAGPATRAA